MSPNGSPEGKQSANFGNGNDINGSADNRNATSMIFVCREIIQEILDMESNVESLRKELSYR